MAVELRFFANFREAVGQKTIEREYDAASSIGGVLHAISEEYPDIEFFEEDGTLRSHLTIMKNGRNIDYVGGLDGEMEDGDTLSIFPPVAGGTSRTRRDRSPVDGEPTSGRT